MSWIMIAGPYSSGGADAEKRSNNLRAMNEAALVVFQKGHTPVIGVNMALPVIGVAGDDRFEEIMMPMYVTLAERCDAILRIGGTGGRWSPNDFRNVHSGNQELLTSPYDFEAK